MRCYATNASDGRHCYSVDWLPASGWCIASTSRTWRRTLVNPDAHYQLTLLQPRQKYQLWFIRWKCSWRLQSIQQFKFNAVCHVYGTVAVNVNLRNIVLFWETQRGSADMDLWNTGCMSVFSKGMQLWLGLLHCGLDNTKFMAQMHQ